MNSTPATLTEDLTAEARRLLDAAPDVIGGDLPAAVDPAAQDQTEPVGLALGSAIVTEENAAGVLRGIGDTLATWRKREAYKLAGERAAENCSGPLAQVANQAWAQFAPAFMQSLESSWPGMIPLCAGLAFAFGPAVMEDIRESGKENARRGLIVEERKPAPPPAAPAPPPATPRTNGLIVEK